MSAPDPAPPPAPPSRWPLRLLTAACVLALAGIGVSVVHFLWPAPIMFALFMTVGQGSFGLAMILYLAVIFMDLRRSRVL